ncbi:MAG: hypothetical protein ACLP8S_01760 [Solirubrobacteraceae bacterium]
MCFSGSTLGIRLREIGDRVGITERAAHNIVKELAAGGYISRELAGRRNNLTIHPAPRLGRVVVVAEVLVDDALAQLPAAPFGVGVNGFEGHSGDWCFLSLIEV